MTDLQRQFVESWLFDPTIGKLISTAVVIITVMAFVRILRGILNRYVQEPGNLYRAKKLVTFLGYFTGLIIVSLIFSDRLGKMARTFALQDAIARRARECATILGILRSDLNFAISRALKEQGIEIPFPQRDLHIRSGTLAIKQVAS